MRSKLMFALLLVCPFVVSTSLTAQTISTSQIRGTIQDASGAAVAGAEVKLTQTATGSVRTVNSGADGVYTIPELSPGPYQLEVTKEGFSKYLQTGIVVQVGVSPTIDVTLSVGSLTQQVEVKAAAAMVETQSTGVGEVVAPQQVQDLPLNGRQLTDLLYLSGAVGQGRAFRASYPSSATPSIAGGGAGSVAYWLDGGTYNDPLSNQNLPLPFPDTVEEFKVETSSLPAQYGTHPSGAVNVVTKSGTNAFHGDVFEYLRNYIFDARNTAFAAAATGTEAERLAASPRDDLKRNQFGGTFGGPISRDRLFFFLGWQDTIQRSTSPAETSLPTAAMLNGDFTQYAANCGGATLGGPFVGNMTSPANYSAVVLKLESFLPKATNPCGIYNYQSPANFTENQGLARIDYHASSRDTIFGRYFIANLNEPPGTPSQGLLIAALDGAADRVQTLTIGDTYLLGSNTVNDFRITGDRTVNRTVQNSTVTIGDLFTDAGLPAPNIYQLAPPKFPNYMITWGINSQLGGFLESTPSLQPYDTIEVSDDLSLTRGPHQFSFGMDYINLRAFATNYLNSQGAFNFDGSRTGLGLADYLLGWTSNSNGFTQAAPVPSIQHQNVFALYGQDAWKATRKLTVTVGLRWDPFFGHTDPAGHVVSISIPNLMNDVHSTRFPTAPAGYLFNGDPGGPRNNKLTGNALDKWSPRIGLAWDPRGNGRMVVRAGFGIFYDFPNFSYDQFGFEEPYGGSVTVPGAGCTTTCLSDPWANFSFIDQQGNTHAGGNPFPQYVGTGPTNVAYLPGALVFSYPLSVKPTYLMQYNLSVQKQVGASWVLSISYLGNQQRHLWVNNEANPGLQGACPPMVPGFVCPSLPIPGFSVLGTTNARRLFNYPWASCGPGPTGFCYGETILLDEGGTGDYNGMLLSAQHPFAKHFTSTTNYTWSHCISDNATTALGLFLVTDMVPYNRRADRGNCPSVDTRNIFNQSIVAETPKFSSHLAQILLGDWRLSVSTIIQSGTVLSGFGIAPSTTVDWAGDGNGLQQRPNLVGSPYCQPKGRTCWLNPASFAPPSGVPTFYLTQATLGSAAPFGNLGNNTLFGPGSVIVNTGLARIFPIREGQLLEFRWEVFNLPNRVNLYPPSGIGAGLPAVFPTFGQPTPVSVTGLGALAQTVNDPRIMQFALKYSF
jgi:Carboxypeptidase regulatory-like domain/TonB dependent receptor